MRTKILAELSDKIRIYGLHPAVCQELVDTQKAINPQWEAMTKFSPRGVAPPGVPQYRRFAVYADDVAKPFVEVTRGVRFNKLSPESLSWIKQAEVVDRRTFVPFSFPRPKLTMNREQAELLDALDSTLKTDARPFGNFLFLASTSVGKTILQCEIARRLGQRTIVLCPTELIFEAWYSDLLKYFKLRPVDVGLIKASKWKIEGPITLASPQTLRNRKDRWPELFKQFGTLVMDEVQTISAPEVYKFVSSFPGAYIVGATATEKRNEKSIAELVYTFGPPVHRIDTLSRETSSSMPLSEVHIVDTDFRFPFQKGNLDWHELSQAFLSDEERNQLIVSRVLSEWADGRTVIVVTKTREHTELLATLLKEAGVLDVRQINGTTNADKSYTRLLLRHLSQRHVRCVVATIQAVKTGANIRALDSMHIAMPPASIDALDQLVGRLRRKFDSRKTKISLTWYYDQHVGYLTHLFKKTALPLFRKMKVPGFDKIYTT